LDFAYVLLTTSNLLAGILIAVLQPLTIGSLLRILSL